MTGAATRRLDRVANAACDRDVVVFDQNCIVESEAVVRTAAVADRGFFQCT